MVQNYGFVIPPPAIPAAHMDLCPLLLAYQLICQMVRCNVHALVWSKQNMKHIRTIKSTVSFTAWIGWNRPMMCATTLTSTPAPAPILTSMITLVARVDMEPFRRNGMPTAQTADARLSMAWREWFKGPGTIHATKSVAEEHNGNHYMSTFSITTYHSYIYTSTAVTTSHHIPAYLTSIPDTFISEYFLRCVTVCRYVKGNGYHAWLCPVMVRGYKTYSYYAAYAYL